MGFSNMAKKNRVIKNLTGANRVSAKYYNLAIRNKRRSKKDCAYYNSNVYTCSKKDVNCNQCQGISNCSMFRQRKQENNDKRELRFANDEYIEKPKMASIQTSQCDGTYSRLADTPMHIAYIKNKTERRHKAKCKYYNKSNKFCKWKGFRCPGSAQCNKYKSR